MSTTTDAPEAAAAPAAPSVKELTYAEIAEYKDKKKMYTVIHDKVYDMTAFVDEHPGGEEVLLDVAGVDSTESFEDVGHSDEAREILKDLLIGNLKRLPNDPKPKVAPPADPSTAGGEQPKLKTDYAALAVKLYAVLAVLGAVGYALYLKSQ